jgi:hypothetical protein
MLRLVARFADNESEGWAEVELQFDCDRGLPDYLVAATCKRVEDALRRKGLLVASGEPRLTAAGHAALVEER